MPALADVTKVSSYGATLAGIYSLVRGEFLPRRRKPILLAGLMYSIATNQTGQNEATAFIIGAEVAGNDGALGALKRVVVDPGDHCVAHVLLQEGHLWGKKRVAIPIGAVTRIDDGVRLDLSKREVEDLPSVDVGDLGTAIEQEQ